MDNKSSIYTTKNPASAVMITPEMIATRTKITRSLFLKKAISPVTRPAREKIPATVRDRKERGKGSTNGFHKNCNIKNDTTETTTRIIEDFPERVVAE